MRWQGLEASKGYDCACRGCSHTWWKEREIKRLKTCSCAFEAIHEKRKNKYKNRREKSLWNCDLFSSLSHAITTSFTFFFFNLLYFSFDFYGRLLVPCLSRAPAPETGTGEGLCRKQRYVPGRRRTGSGGLPAVLMAPDCLCTGRMGAGTGRAEELSKELSRRSLIHAWCTTRWQNTATAYGGGGRGRGGQWMEGNRGEGLFVLIFFFPRERAVRPILKVFN